MSLTQPELAIVSAQPDDPVMVSLVSQFLENEIFFECGENQNLLPSLPADLAQYRAVAFDQPSFEAAMKDEATRQRIIEYAGVAEKKLVVIMEELIKSL